MYNITPIRLKKNTTNIQTILSFQLNSLFKISIKAITVGINDKKSDIKITGIKKGFIISIYILLSVSFICDDPLVAEKPKTKGTHLHIPKRFAWRRSIFLLTCYSYVDFSLLDIIQPKQKLYCRNFPRCIFSNLYFNQ